MEGWQDWAGGDEAPADWNYGEVLLRNGQKGYPGYWEHHGDGGDIVGYKTHQPPYHIDGIEVTAKDWAYAYACKNWTVEGRAKLFALARQGGAK